MANLAAAVEISRIDIKTMLLRRESGLLLHNFRQPCHAAPTLLPYAIGRCPTDNPPVQSCRGDNLNAQQGGLPQTAANAFAEIERASQTLNPIPCTSILAKWAWSFQLLIADRKLLTLMPLASSDATWMPIVYGEKRVRIGARVMAWRPAPQKVGISGIPASSRPSKKWHPMTHCDAHSVALGLKARLWSFILNLAPCTFQLLVTDDLRLRSR